MAKIVKIDDLDSIHPSKLGVHLSFGVEEKDKFFLLRGSYELVDRFKKSSTTYELPDHEILVSNLDQKFVYNNIPFPPGNITNEVRFKLHLILIDSSFVSRLYTYQ